MLRASSSTISLEVHPGAPTQAAESPSTAAPAEASTKDLTADERQRATAVYKSACTKAQSTELDMDAFSQCMKELIIAGNEKALANGGDAQPMPSEADLKAAFVTADADHGGTIDEEEFIQLYAKVKSGEIGGLSGGFFSTAMSAFSSWASREELSSREERYSGPVLVEAGVQGRRLGTAL